MIALFFLTLVSRLIKTLSLIKRSNLLTSEAKMSELPKSMEYPHFPRTSKTADGLTFLTLFSINQLNLKHSYVQLS